MGKGAAPVVARGVEGRVEKVDLDGIILTNRTHLIEVEVVL